MLTKEVVDENTKDEIEKLVLSLDKVGDIETLIKVLGKQMQTLQGFKYTVWSNVLLLIALKAHHNLALCTTLLEFLICLRHIIKSKHIINNRLNLTLCYQLTQ
jgi:hypothetical protein